MPTHFLKENTKATKEVKDKKEEKKIQKQKSKEQSQLIYKDIIKYQLTKVCKENAKVIALLFKALIRAEAIKRKEAVKNADSNGDSKISLDKEF